MVWIVLAFLVLIYFLPAIVAMKRSHPNGPAIVALNLLLGWTFVGWVAALVWSLTYVPAPRELPAPDKIRDDLYIHPSLYRD